MEQVVIRPSRLRMACVIGMFVLVAGSFWSEAVEEDDPAMGVIAAPLTILCCYLVAVSLRTAVRADRSGITVTEGLSKRRHFDWPEIADFRVGEGRKGPVVYLVPREGASMVRLLPTQRYSQSAVEHQVAVLRGWLLR